MFGHLVSSMHQPWKARNQQLHEHGKQRVPYFTRMYDLEQETAYDFYLVSSDKYRQGKETCQIKSDFPVCAPYISAGSPIQGGRRASVQ